MTHVATLIGPNALDAAALANVRAALPGASEPQRLGAGAADISFSASAGLDQRGLAEKLRALAEGVDVVVQPAANRRKKLVSGRHGFHHDRPGMHRRAGGFRRPEGPRGGITARAMRGEIAFEPALRERVALLKGLSTSTIGEVILNRITLTPGARTLVATMRANGAFTCMVSGGFTLFTQPIAAMIGFDETRANTLVLDGELLAGLVSEPIFGRETKRASLIELRTRLQLAKDDTLVAGDGANDMDMIAEAGLGVAYHAKPKVAAAAPARIDHTDLTALLYIQGYRQDEFVAA
jgi:phosphoserine phosphatase